MKFKINRDHFSNGLAQVLNVVGSKATMPILSNVLIEAEKDYISLTTTNLDLGIRCKIKAEVKEGGSVTLPVKRLATTDTLTMIEALTTPETAACFSVVAEGEARSWQGLLMFQDPTVLDKLVPALPPASAGPVEQGFDGLRLPLAFRIGNSVLSLAEVRGIRPGDIVSVEHWTAAGTGLIVQATVGGDAGRQLIARAEGSRITVTHWRDALMNRDELAVAADGDDVTGLPLDRLDALEVALRFEVGHLTLSLGDLRNIGPGHVFDLAQPLNRSPVRILAHGNVLGKGFLVAVGERLGVRVSEFAPTELKS